MHWRLFRTHHVHEGILRSHLTFRNLHSSHLRSRVHVSSEFRDGTSSTLTISWGCSRPAWLAPFGSSPSRPKGREVGGRQEASTHGPNVQHETSFMPVRRVRLRRHPRAFLFLSGAVQTRGKGPPGPNLALWQVVALLEALPCRLERVTMAGPQMSLSPELTMEVLLTWKIPHEVNSANPQIPRIKKAEAGPF